MADNITYSSGADGGVPAATVQKTDDVAGAHVPYVKLLDGTADSAAAIAGDATNGLDVDVTRVGGNVTVVQATATNLKVDASGVAVPVTDNAGSLTIDNAALAVVGGGVEATALRVTLASDSTGLVSVDDNAGSLTVDNAALAVTGGGVEASALRVTLANDSTGVLSVDDNGSTLSIDDGAASLTVDNATISVVGSGTEATAQRVTIATDSTGLLSVDDNGGSLTVDNATISVVGGGTEATAQRVTIANDSTGVLSVDDNGGALTVDGTVSVNLNAGTNTNEVVGDIAHDTGVSGNPVQIAGAAQDSDDTAPPNRVSAESDVTRLATDRDGSLHVLTHGPQIWSYHENSSSALTDASVHAAPGVGLSLYVTDIVVSTGAATALNVFFEEGASTVLGPYYLEAVAGRGLAIHFGTPKKITANTALTVTTSAAIAHGIDVTGYVGQG